MNDKVKIILAVALLAIAGLVVAWQMGVFSSGPEGRSNSDQPTVDLDADPGLENFQGEDGRGGAAASPRQFPTN